MLPLTVIKEPKPSNFDDHHPPDPALIGDCVHCGFCLPACPTYVLWGEEMDSPRGRIYMMKKSTTGEAPLDQRFQQHMDNCLGCMACMTACPSGVQYDKLIEDARAQVERNIPRTTSESLFRKMLFVTFPYANRLRLLALPLLLYQRSGMQNLIRAIGILRFIPKQLSAMESLLPTVPTALFRRLPAYAQPSAAPRLRVGMLAGCVQQVFFQHVNEATIRVLVAEGCEVFIPQSQPCCGALMVHSGLDTAAADFARRMISIFEKANVDVIAINAAGCGSTMKEYGHLLRDDPEWAARAVSFSAKCKDISEILCDLTPQSPRHALPMRIAYHDACHLRHAQGIFEQPRRLLATIPGLDLVEVEEMNFCCGSAGVYNLLHPDAANQLGDRKVANLLATKAQAVISANPGCLIQLMSGLRRRGLNAMPTFHMVELLDASIRGISPATLLQLKPSALREDKHNAAVCGVSQN
jgi:glycolate oxidase iron-sulfur subunit